MASDILKLFKRLIKKTLPYHETSISVEYLERACRKIEKLKAENKKLAEGQKAKKEAGS